MSSAIQNLLLAGCSCIRVLGVAYLTIFASVCSLSFACCILNASNVFATAFCLCLRYLSSRSASFALNTDSNDDGAETEPEAEAAAGAAALEDAARVEATEDADADAASIDRCLLDGCSGCGGGCCGCCARAALCCALLCMLGSA